MECDNQAVHMLKAGETVRVYYDQLTEEQDQCLERTDSIIASSSTQANLKSAAPRDEPRHVHSIGTQTDHDGICGSTVPMKTRNDGTKGRDKTNSKSYNSTSTETDLSTIGDRKTLESLLRWALAICTSDGDLSAKDFQELQYPNRNTNPLPSFPRVYQQGKTTSDSQHPIDLEITEYEYNTKGNNDTSSDRICKMFREDDRQDGNLLGQTCSSSLGPSDLQADTNVIQSMEIEHHVAYDQLQSTATISDHLQANTLRLDKTPDKQQEASIGMTISGNLLAPDRRHRLDIGTAPLVEQSIIVHLDEHLPVYASNGTCSKEKCVINENPCVQGGPIVGGREEGTAHDVFDKNVSTSSMKVTDKTDMNPSQMTRMASAVMSDYSCGMQNSMQPEDQPNDMDSSTQAEERPYECDVCGKRFKKKHHLKTHLRIHINVGPFQCEVCEKQFASKSNLKIHIRVHSQEKPYACTICERRFTQSGSLTAHKRVHTGEKPYLCQVCGKTFTRQSGLKDHLIVHSGEKLYECSECGKRFRHRTDRSKHMSKHELAKSS